jgi:hypothetical protein
MAKAPANTDFANFIFSLRSERVVITLSELQAREFVASYARVLGRNGP